jgi:hypothetical protein
MPDLLPARQLAAAELRPARGGLQITGEERTPSMKRHPLLDEIGFPKPAKHEIDIIAEDMRQNGWDKTKPSFVFQKHVLDGNTREAAAKLAGIKPYRRIFRGTKDEAIDFALRTEAMRRPLTPEQQEKYLSYRRVKAADMREKGASTRAIADKLQISKTTVMRDLDKTAHATPETVTSADGRQRPARMTDNRCARCKRMYVNANVSVKGCEECKRLRAEAAAIKKGHTEPGTHEPRRRKRTSGNAAYDFRKLNDFYGCLTREIDKMARPFDRINSPKTQELRKELADWKTHFVRVYTDYSRSNAPEDA